MATKINAKTLRRAETDIDSEIIYVTNSFSDIRYEELSSEEKANRAALDKVASTIDRYQKLNSAKFVIRKIIAEFNESKGINNKTAEIAELEGLLSLYNDHIMRIGRVSSRSRYNSNATYYTPGFKPEDVDSMRAEVRKIQRKIQSLKDSCNGINSAIELQDKVPAKLLEFLKIEGFIAE